MTEAGISKATTSQATSSNAANRASTADGSDAEATRAQTRPRILLAEDDDDLRWGITLFLEQEGFEVCAVASGYELLAEMTDRLDEGLPPRVDAIVTDVRMPGLQSLNIVAGLSDLGVCPPVVVMSAFADEDIAQRAMSIGAAAFLLKPFDPKALSNIIRTVLDEDGDRDVSALLSTNAVR